MEAVVLGLAMSDDTKVHSLFSTQLHPYCRPEGTCPSSGGQAPPVMTKPHCLTLSPLTLSHLIEGLFPHSF